MRSLVLRLMTGGVTVFLLVVLALLGTALGSSAPAAPADVSC